MTIQAYRFGNLAQPFFSNLELGRRAVACHRWRWMPGMLGVTKDGAARYLGRDLWWDSLAEEVLLDQPEGIIPSLQDSATLGCLTDLVAECWGTQGHGRMSFQYLGCGKWSLWFESGGGYLPDDHFAAIGQARVLVAALEAAP